MEADSASGSVTMRTYVGGSVEISGDWIYISRSSFPPFNRMEEEPMWVSESGRRKGCGGGRLTFVERPLCIRHLIRALVQGLLSSQ